MSNFRCGLPYLELQVRVCLRQFFLSSLGFYTSHTLRASYVKTSIGCHIRWVLCLANPGITFTIETMCNLLRCSAALFAAKNAKLQHTCARSSWSRND
jgi:hypothetical protein